MADNNQKDDLGLSFYIILGQKNHLTRNLRESLGRQKFPSMHKMKMGNMN